MTKRYQYLDSETAVIRDSDQIQNADVLGLFERVPMELVGKTVGECAPGCFRRPLTLAEITAYEAKRSTHRIILGDCLSKMAMMPPNSVDLVFCSPPYEAARTYGIGFSLKGDAWVDWAFDRYMQCVRVCKGLVAWVVEGQTRQFRWSATPALLMAKLHNAGVKLRKPPIFHRVGIPGSGGPDWLRNDYEFIVCSSKGKLPWSDNTAMGHPPKWAPGGAMSNRVSNGVRCNQWGPIGSSKGFGARNRHGKHRPTNRPSHFDPTAKTQRQNGADGNLSYDPPVKANPGNVIKCNVGGGAMGSKLAHDNEAPFPASLCEFFIRSFCPPGGIVLDPFCGSGTTLAVATKHGRNSIGIDIRDGQIDLTKRRIEEAG